MKTPIWLSPALYGAAAGAAALAFVGFNWGGWVTAGTAQSMSAEAARVAVATSLTPYCLAMAEADPQSATVLAELGEAKGYNRRRIIEKAGWATPLGAEQPDRALAVACEQALATT
ncbi:MAG: hypothetical protein K8H74_19690 [Notoacmeibacter sp.]|nr:hypothetical protein [Notoacmeibacter sp.]